MNATISAVRAGRRALALSALAAAYLATTLGLTTDQALAASTPRVKAGTLTISGDAAARRRSDGDPQPRATEN